MFVILEKTLNGWAATPYTGDEVFDSHEEAAVAADDQNLVDVAIFEFKGFI